MLIASMAATFIVTRAFLHARPETDLSIGTYNVHHLFTGVLLIAICGIPALVYRGHPCLWALSVAGFGAGLALALDEWVYLIVTDGSNAAYTQPISLIPGAVLVFLACGYAAIVTRLTGGCD